MPNTSIPYAPTVAPSLPVPSDENTHIVNVLTGYKREAEENRKSGLNPREDKWSDNLNQYWNRRDYSKKADWQAKQLMPEVPNFVDRFAAALKEALVNTPEGFYTVIDPYDEENDLSAAIKRMTDVWLSTIGKSQTGGLLGFPAVFEEQMKLGAMMACSGVVTWREDVPFGRVAFETVDPRHVWLDHTYRNLYRIRRVEMDLHDLHEMVGMKSSKGNPVFNVEEVGRLISSVAIDEMRWRAEAAGHGVEVISNRKPVVLDEYRATVVDQNGNVIERDGLFVVANDRFLIRGPEKNPYWHNADWLIYAPLVTTPLSVYGRSYMEDFGSVASTFTEVTNMLIDAIHVSSLNAWAVVPSMLVNPGQINTGITPNKTFLLEDGAIAKDFAEKLELGHLDAGAIQFWQALKSELSEAAGINEIGLGQFAPNSRTSATEISETQHSSSALVRSVAQTIETRFIDPMLDLTWKTGVQHMRPGDKRMAGAADDAMYAALLSRKRELVSHPATFQARGISTMIQRTQLLNKVITLMQVIAQSEQLLAAFMQKVDPNKLLDFLFRLSGVDISRMTLSTREQMIQGLMPPIMDRASQGSPSAPVQQEMGGVANMLGIAR